MTLKTQDGTLYVIAGASRSGKTARTKELVKKEKRLSVWDPEAQWCELPGFVKVTTRAQLAKALTTKGPFKVAYVAGGSLKEEFDFWAKVTYYAGRYIAPLGAVSEELADVTTIAKAPDNWGILVRRGLKRTINIYAISQRWSEADKTAFGNASVYIMFRQSSGDDVRYLARKTSAPFDELNDLKQFEYIEKCAITGTFKRGKLKF